MDFIVYNDLQNQVIDDKYVSDHLEARIKNVADLFNNKNNIYIRNIYLKLYELNENIKNDNLELVVFIIFIFIKEDNINLNKDLMNLYKKYEQKMAKLFNENDPETLFILFYTYIYNLYNIGIKDIINDSVF